MHNFSPSLFPVTFTRVRPFGSRAERATGRYTLPARILRQKAVYLEIPSPPEAQCTAFLPHRSAAAKTGEAGSLTKVLTMLRTVPHNRGSHLLRGIHVKN